MAGIEKICEYSGEYPGPLMYGYKHDLIQIMPEYRKEFEKKEHTLYICKEVGLYEDFKGVYGSLREEGLEKINGHYYARRRFRPGWERLKRLKIIKQIEYCLYVPSMPGRVEGFYYNYTYNLSTVKRKLKNMLKVKKLNVKYISTNEEFYKLSESEH